MKAFSKIANEIESGSFGKVYSAANIPTGQTIAMKVIPNKRISQNESSKPNQVSNKQEAIENEIKFLKLLNHPFTTFLYGVTKDENETNLLLEYHTGSSLYDIVKKETRLSEIQARKLFIQIAFALKYLHQTLKIVHRDLKLENIILDSKNNVHIIDFGFAHEMSRDDFPFMTTCGTIDYLAPEILTSSCATSLSDIWSLGVILYCLVVGHFPFSGETRDEIAHEIRTKPIEFPQYLSQQLIHLLRRLLDKEPKSRITINEILEHPWVNPTSIQLKKINSSLEQLHLDDTSKLIDENILIQASAKIFETLSNKENSSQEQIMEHIKKGIKRNNFDEYVSVYRILYRNNVMQLFDDLMTSPSLTIKTTSNSFPSIQPPILSASKITKSAFSSSSSNLAFPSLSPENTQSIELPKPTCSPLKNHRSSTLSFGEPSPSFQPPKPSALVPPQSRRPVIISARRASQGQIRSPSLSNVM